MGRPVNPFDIIVVERERSRRGRQPSLYNPGEATFLVSTVLAEEKRKPAEVKRILEPVARAQEPQATPQRISELVDRIFDRAFNVARLYCNTKTGEVST